MTLLHLAAPKCYAEDITSLLDSGASIDTVNNNGNTALHIASENWQDTILRILLDKGANKELQNKNGEIPLHVAAHVGRLASLRALLEAGADHRTLDQNGRTPRQSAEAAKVEHIRMLIKQWEDESYREELRSQVECKIHEAAEEIWNGIVKVLQDIEALELS
ncbi:hypothetical protein F53441_11093 [Fusarium austroafricanum]|uniref:Ankyrin repeat protein n=1 Tax=Fusarium austroafricanum TaxID=2364996 RepID=A0A8H4K6C3_9HYPO|nr:hypothetical protein F53441_11093 [Fusarium austroafricanum]